MVETRWKRARDASGVSVPLGELRAVAKTPPWFELAFVSPIRAAEGKAGVCHFPHNVSWRSPHNLLDTLYEKFMRNLGRDTNGTVAAVTVQAGGVGMDQLR